MSALFLMFATAAFVAVTNLQADDEQTEPKPDAEGFYELFNGTDLTGWKPSENPETFFVEDGNLVVHGKRSHLYYVGPIHNNNWKNFHLKAELMTFPEANSGIYFHTEFLENAWPEKGFECQVNETHGDYKKTGGLYDVEDVLDVSPVNTGEWYTYDIIVNDEHVILKINGNVTCDWTQPENWQPPSNHVLRYIDRGQIALQGHDPNSKALFRSIKIKSLD